MMKGVQCKRRKPYHFQCTGYLAEYVTAIIKDLHRGFCRWLHPLIRFSSKRSHIDSFKLTQISPAAAAKQAASWQPTGFTSASLHAHSSLASDKDRLNARRFLMSPDATNIETGNLLRAETGVPYHGFARGTPVKILIRFCLIIHQSPPVSPGSYRRQQTWWYRRRRLAVGE